MKRQTRRFTFALVSWLLLLTLLTACQPIAPTATTIHAPVTRAVAPRFDAEVINHKNLTLLKLDAPAASVCPTNVADMASYQQQATKVVSYLLGGENPFRGVGCNYSACANLAAVVSASQCVLSAAVPGNVCGLQAGLPGSTSTAG